MRLLYTLLCAVLITLTACTEGDENRSIIDLNNYKELPLADFDFSAFDSRTVELKSEEAVIGQLEKVKTFNGNILVMNQANRLQQNLLAYAEDGTFETVVGNIGRGPGEYLHIADFDINDKGDIVVVDRRSDQILFYNKFYDFKKSIHVESDIESISFLPDDNFLIALSAANTGLFSGTMLAVVDSSFKKAEKELVDYKVHDPNYVIPTLGIVSIGNEHFFHLPFEDDVYCIKGNNHEMVHYYVDFGKDKIPDEHKSDLSYIFETDKYLEYTTIIDFFVVGEKYMAGRLQRKENKYYVNFIADISNRIIYTEERGTGGKDRYFAGTDGHSLIIATAPTKLNESYSLEFIELFAN